MNVSPANMVEEVLIHSSTDMIWLEIVLGKFAKGHVPIIKHTLQYFAFRSKIDFKFSDILEDPCYSLQKSAK